MGIARRHRYRRRATVIVVLSVALGLVGCDAAPTLEPRGDPEVHVLVDAAGIHLAPSTIQAGTIDVVDDSLRDKTAHAMFTFVSRASGSLTDEDLAALSQGRRVEGLILDGGWGPVTKLTLGPGTFAFTTATDAVVGSDPAPSIAILVVAP